MMLPDSATFATLRFSGRKRLPQIHQSGMAECGPACLAMVLGYHGHRIDMNTLRQRFSVSSKGINLSGLMDMAQRLGLACRPLSLELQELSMLQTPCVLHWDLNHFVVLKRVRGRRVTIHDPAHGPFTLALEEAGKHFSGVAMELTPTPAFRVADETSPLRLGDFWRRASGLKPALLQILALSICLQLLALASPFYLQLVVDEAIVGQDLELLSVLAVGFGLLSAISIATSLLRSWISLYLGNLFSFQLAINLFTHLIHLPADYFSRRHVGDIVSRFGSLAPIREMVTTGAIAVVLDGLMAVTTLVMIFIYSPLLSWIVLSGLLLYALIRLVAYHPLRQLTQEGIVAGAQEQSHFMESLRAIQSIKQFGHEQGRTARWQNRYADTINLGIRLGRLKITFSTIHAVLGSAENILVIYIGALSVIDGTFTVGMLYAYIAYKNHFTGAVANLINQAISLKMLGLHLERLSDIALTPVERGNIDSRGLDAPPLPQITISGELELRQISYRYSDNEPWLIRNTSLHVLPGECIAIIGASGCGKSTLLRIMLGLLNPGEGEVLIDGRDLSRIDLMFYRQQIACVLQDDQLLSGSLTDNISMFSQEVSATRVEQAATLAHIHQDIEAMPMAYNTLVGDMGSSLSGGQKQRILLARALYHQPRILFLDEATSSLELNLEKQISHAINALTMTRIIVAHRPQTVSMADRIFRFHRGRLIELQYQPATRRKNP